MAMLTGPNLGFGNQLRGGCLNLWVFKLDKIKDVKTFSSLQNVFIVFLFFVCLFVYF